MDENLDLMLSAFASLPEGWNAAGWSEFTRQSGLTHRRTEHGRLEYSWENLPELHAWADERGICRAQVDLVVYWHDDDYEIPDIDAIYEDMLAEFNQVLSVAQTVVGPPDFQGDETVPGFPMGHIGDPTAIWYRPHHHLVLELICPEGYDVGPWMVTLAIERKDWNPGRD